MSANTKLILTYVIGVVAFLGLIVWFSQRDKQPTNPEEQQSVLTIAPDEWVKGGKNATVTLIEYSDFQCPACKSYQPILDEVTTAFGNQLRFVYRHFPLSTIHANALPAAKAAEAAGRQDKFWQMHDILFDRQGIWSSSRDVDVILADYAKELGLNEEQFVTDYTSEAVREAVQADIDGARGLGITGTPSFFFNGQPIQNPQSAEEFKKIIQAGLDNAPLPEIDPNDLAAAKDVHEHADFVVSINGKKLDFSAAKYQSDEKDSDGKHDHSAHEHDPYVHLHSGNGKIIHIHKEGITLGYFLKTIGLEFTDTCFKQDTGEEYCTNVSSSVKLFVNGKRNTRNGGYTMKDADRILITYGPLADSNLQKQIDLVSNDACIYSETCPERGKPPEEACVGGPGTKCEG